MSERGRRAAVVGIALGSWLWAGCGSSATPAEPPADDGGGGTAPGGGGEGPGGSGAGGDAEPTSWSTALSEDLPYLATGADELAFHPVLMLPGVALSAGDETLVEAFAQVQGPAGLDQPILVAPKVTCSVDTAVSQPGVWSWANWEGATLHPDGVHVQVRERFTAPADGVYHCSLELLSGAGAGLPPETFMTALADATRLRMRLVEPSGVASWYASEPLELLAGASAPALEHLSTAPAGAETVTLFTDVQLSSCPPGSDTKGWCQVAGDGSISDVATRMHVVQLMDDGVTPCAEHEDEAQVGVITNPAHHAKRFHQLTVPVDGSCSTMFRSWVDIEVLGGNPVKLETAFPIGPLTHGALVDGPLDPFAP